MEPEDFLPNEIKKTPAYWGQTFANHMATSSTFGPASGVLYLAPIESAGDWKIRNTYRYRYGYTGIGTWSFNFFIGIYRLMRGTGGTANTLVLETLFPQGASTHTSAGGPGTEYSCAVALLAFTTSLPEGEYFVGFLWKDLSTFPNRMAITAYGRTIPSFNGPFNRGDGSGYTALPATVASFTGVSTFCIYCETN